MSLTAEERQHLLRELREQEASLRQATQAWHQPSPDGAWSVAEICEHLDKADRQIFQLVQSSLLYGDQLPPSTWVDQPLFDRASTRGRTAESPQHLLPEGTWTSAAEFWAAYGDFRQEMHTWIESTDAPLRDGRFEHPMLGVFDGFQWLLFLAAHGRRHTAQILERGQ